jgi:hypothetical protein
MSEPSRGPHTSNSALEQGLRPNPDTLRAWLEAACRESPVLISRAAQPTFGRVLARMKASAALL